MPRLACRAKPRRATPSPATPCLPCHAEPRPALPGRALPRLACHAAPSRALPSHALPRPNILKPGPQFKRLAYVLLHLFGSGFRLF